MDADRLADELDRRLAHSDALLAASYPGARAGRQPVHTVYVPADRYRTDLAADWGAQALATMHRHEGIFRELVGDDDLIERVRTKLRTEPVEDVRLDFEDGYGNRGDEVEDLDAATAAESLSTGLQERTAAPFHGIRIKSFEAATRRRGVRTFLRFVCTLVDKGAPLTGFVTTLPKVTSVEQVTAMAYMCHEVESDLGLGAGDLRFEIQVETPQAILAADGTAPVAGMIHAAEGRCIALHFGTYDYTASVGVAAGYQSLDHPVADHAKLVMQAAAAGTGVRLSDGSTNLLPVGDAGTVRSGWAEHLHLVRHGLERGYYQGWDLHPAQLPTRHAATIGFYRAGLADATGRLRDYLAQRGGAVLDEPATARAMIDYLVRAVDCGAATADEIEAATGAPLARLTMLAGGNQAAH